MILLPNLGAQAWNVVGGFPDGPVVRIEVDEGRKALIIFLCRPPCHRAK
jgi:hypothetical protein